MSKQFVSQLRPGDKVEGYFAVVSKQLVPFSAKSSRAGEEYLKITLRDVSGTIEGRVWNDALSLNSIFDVDDIVYIEGKVIKFNNLQITIHNIEYTPKDGMELDNFIPTSSEKISVLWEQFEHMLAEIDNFYLKKLLYSLFSEDFKEKFKKAPAGKSIHHAYRGGLLKHTLETGEIAKKICEIYDNKINKEILLAGSLLHDIGKTKEYDLTSITFKLTDKGKLHGHIVLGRDILIEHAAKIDNFPPELIDELGHMIISHHGCQEWGSPEIPKTIEALALHHADLTGARVSQALDAISSLRTEETWTNWDRYLQRSFFNPFRDKYF